ncbi:Hypothetical Protein FCC1311_082752 [Hondaea fermentalgiana]|uniref:Uncharacterized protein n=1 Tax=Hondaea fermentalgiana TaxID=2315210 RepID=A0A2R5GME1_9STRA|nr:Hypothetical Protein FCC1311_082752 [Hondaea fermentalgiana]|eukprot:GBG32050.1 Hypothetical Protein FCC1311_082752 [Hondaea fermentalgiana]
MADIAENAETVDAEDTMEKGEDLETVDGQADADGTLASKASEIQDEGELANEDANNQSSAPQEPSLDVTEEAAQSDQESALNNEETSNDAVGSKNLTQALQEANEENGMATNNEEGKEEMPSTPVDTAVEAAAVAHDEPESDQDSKSSSNLHVATSPAIPTPNARSPRKLKLKKPASYETPPPPTELASPMSPSAHAKVRSVSCEMLASASFAKTVFQKYLWVYHGVGRTAGLPSRVLLVTGQRKDPIERQSIASAVLHTALHSGAIVVENGGEASLFHGITGFPKTLPDMIGLLCAGAAEAALRPALACAAHRATFCIESCASVDEEDFAQAQCNFAHQLAGGNKIVVLDVGTDLSHGAASTAKAAHRQGWPIVALADGCHPGERTRGVKWASFAHNAYCHEAELSSFIHLHLTVDLF